MGDGAFVFISYSRADARAAAWLAGALAEMGVVCWRDLAEVAVGQWRAEIDRGITASRAVFVLVSPHSMASKEVAREIMAAADQSKNLIPLIVEPSAYPDGVRNALAGLQTIPLYGHQAEQATQRIANALARLGFMLEQTAKTGPVGDAFQVCAIRPQYSSDLTGAALSVALEEARSAHRLAPSNIYTQLNLAVLLLHSGAAGAALEMFRAAARIDPLNSDALHFLSVAELCQCAARRMTLAQVEAVEQRSLRAYSLSDAAGHVLLPLGVVAQDYRAKFGSVLPHGSPAQIADRIFASLGSESEVQRFFGLIDTSFGR